MIRRVRSLAVLLGLLAVSAAASPAEQQAKGPRIAVEPTSFDFGKALQNKTLHKDFVVRNFGSEDLKIGRISTTCGCTAALADTTVVKPGASTILHVDLQTRAYAGKIERQILVESNDAVNSRLTLKVRATVVSGS